MRPFRLASSPCRSMEERLLFVDAIAKGARFMQEIVNDFMNTFYGYGNTAGRYWFIGMEERCGPNWERDVAPRFEVWRDRGEHDLEDLCAYHARIGIVTHWEKPVAIQATWRRLIQTVLTAEHGVAPTPQEIAAYQAEQLGSLNGQTCLLELFPLPSPRINQFAYARLANDEYPFFATRDQYEEHIAPARIEHLRAMMQLPGERHIVLYGTTHLNYWNALVMNTPWAETRIPQIQHCQLFGKHIWLVPHPTAFGTPGDRYVGLGQLIRQRDMGKNGV